MPGRDERERLGVDVARVVELMDGAAGDAQRLSGPDVDRSALDRPGQDALEPVDRLLVAVVAVPGRASPRCAAFLLDLNQPA